MLPKTRPGCSPVTLRPSDIQQSKFSGACPLGTGTLQAQSSSRSVASPVGPSVEGSACPVLPRVLQMLGVCS